MLELDFTISIPTYNRCELLKRNLGSIEELLYDKSKFEVLIIDDGSIDDTQMFVDSYIKNSNLKIRYYYQENSGKYYALRHAIDIARGRFFINCDSDDYLLPNTLLRLNEVFKSPLFNNNKLAGIIGHNQNSLTKEIQGNRFPLEISNPIEMRFIYNVKGDKFPCFKTAILKKFNFPDYRMQTNFMPESYLFYSISKEYNFLYLNEIFQVCEYQKTGLTNRIQSYRIQNAFGCFKVYELYVDTHYLNFGFKAFARNYINYRRFGYHLNLIIKSRSFIEYTLSKIAWVIYKKDLYENSYTSQKK